MSRSAPSFFTLALGALCALATPAWADVVVLRDGRRVEGAVSRDGNELVVQGRLGAVRFPIDDVREVEESEDLWDRLRHLRLELGQGTADERYRFGVFCRENGFDDDAQEAFLSVLRLDLDHAGARAALGYVRHEGQWITVADRNRLLGLVEHRGEWMTPEERAGRVAEAREAAQAARREREEAVLAERERRRAEREAEQEAERERRLARIKAYDEALARARAHEKAAREERESRRPTTVLGWGGGGAIVNGLYYPYGYPGPVGTRCGPTIVRPSPRIYSPPQRCTNGVGVSGRYNGGNWQLRWRLGY